MTREQVQDEKLDVQKALLQYESLHGRPVSVCVCVHVCVSMSLCVRACVCGQKALLQYEVGGFTQLYIPEREHLLECACMSNALTHSLSRHIEYLSV